MKPARWRDAISRSYYAMYHAARSIAYVAHGGDDNEAHESVYKAIPADFVDNEKWQNELKEARLRRNEADYDPYPPRDLKFKSISVTLSLKAHTFCGLAEGYLQTKGCAL